MRDTGASVQSRQRDKKNKKPKGFCVLPGLCPLLILMRLKARRYCDACSSFARGIDLSSRRDFIIIFSSPKLLAGADCYSSPRGTARIHVRPCACARARRL
jgi:hypothetical protein